MAGETIKRVVLDDGDVNICAAKLVVVVVVLSRALIH